MRCSLLKRARFNLKLLLEVPQPCINNSSRWFARRFKRTEAAIGIQRAAKRNLATPAAPGNKICQRKARSFSISRMGSEAKRRWFQIHLSTSIALMFAAAGILYLNVVPNEEIWTEGSESTRVTRGKVAQLITERAPYIDFTEDGHFHRERHFGWPFVAFFDGDRVRYQSGEWEVRSHWRDLGWDVNLYRTGD
jgi:hypothetical protein